MLDQNTVERINDAARIEDVVSDYVTLRKRGVNLLGLCPFHGEKTPSFTVSPAKGIFKCFGCGKGGNSVNFIMEHEQISYYEALKFLARKYSIEFVERELSAQEQAVRNDRESMFLVNEFAQKFFSNTLLNHLDGKAIGLSYFRERGFRDDIIVKFQLGYSLEQRDAFTQNALKSGYKKEYIVKTGLTLEHDNGQVSDRFRGRVMFPVHSLSGKVVAFGGRILKKDDKMAKYVNSPESEIYHKSNELYGIYFAKQAIVRKDSCYLVEGYTDVISMHQSGIENVVASSGTSLTPGQIRLIHRFTENVTIIYDGDAAGIKASIRGIDLLLEEGLNIKVLLLPNGEDPDSFARNNNASDFIEYVDKNATDFMRFKTRLLIDEAGNDPVKRAGLTRDIVRSIAIIPNNLIRGQYVKECSAMLSVDEALLYHEINQLKTADKEKQITRQNNASPAFPPPDMMVPEEEMMLPVLFDAEERNIVQLLIRYGEEVMYYSDEEQKQPVTVAMFVFDELENDGLKFNNPLYNQICAAYQQRRAESAFAPERFFLHHPDGAIARLATDLATDKYTLSKVHSKMKKVSTDAERLHELAPRLIYEYKNSIILDLTKHKLQEMKIASDAKDYARASEIMKEYADLENVKNQLAKTLGERIIIKI